MRKYLALLGAVLLTACQTMPQSAGFSPLQVQTLEAEGFVATEGNYELGLSSKLLFEFDKSDLKSEVKSDLTRMSQALVKVGIGGATVEGHTDNQGASAYNLKLSEIRAEAVKDVMMAGGMGAASIKTVGYGETDPIEDNATEQGRSENRRVVVVISPSDVIPY